MTSDDGMSYGIISTVPRSGTWYSFFLVDSMDMMLTGRQEFARSHYIERYESMRITKLHVHCVFPCFESIAPPEAVEKFNKLEFNHNGYNHGRSAFGENPILTPLGNQDLRIVYIFRNPLDQLVSFYEHIINHIDKSVRFPRGKHDESRPFSNVDDLAMRGGAESYLKQYFTYSVMRKSGFEGLTMIPYEDLKRDPCTTLDRILHFLRARIHPRIRQTLIENAVAMCGMDELHERERQLGGAIGCDQVGEGQTHARGGDIGKWKKQLSSDVIEAIWRQFREHGIGPEDFVLE